jgi:CRP/FNR family transcriptional regulator
MQTALDCLSRAPVFEKLSDADRAELVSRASRKIQERGETICWQGEPWPNVAYIASGQAEWVMLSPEGKRQVVFKLGACDVVWGHSIFDDQPMPASLEVTQRAEFLLWPREVVIPIVSRHPEAVWETGRVLVNYMRRVREVVYGFAFHPVAGRLARLLLTHYQHAQGDSAPRDLTLDQMADTVGTTRELVSRTLHRFADEGLIRVNRVELTFLDREKLETLAGGNER